MLNPVLMLLEIHAQRKVVSLRVQCSDIMASAHTDTVKVKVTSNIIFIYLVDSISSIIKEFFITQNQSPRCAFFCLVDHSNSI